MGNLKALSALPLVYSISATLALGGCGGGESGPTAATVSTCELLQRDLETRCGVTTSSMGCGEEALGLLSVLKERPCEISAAFFSVEGKEDTARTPSCQLRFMLDPTLRQYCGLFAFSRAPSTPSSTPETPAPLTSTSTLSPTVIADAPPSATLVKVNLNARKITVYDTAGTTMRSYPCAIGKPGFETPKGRFTIYRIIKDPLYDNPFTAAVESIPPGPSNPLGKAFLGFNRTAGGEYGFHGTNEPGSIGQAASHGCLRMYNADVVDLVSVVREGIAVEIY